MGRLETLYREGISFSLIAADIGVTRSAAIGKAHRMHLPKRDTVAQYKAYTAAIRNSKPKKPRRESPAVKMTVPARPPPVIIPDRDYSCTIIELTDTTCRYPLWGVAERHHERRYCGCPGASVSNRLPYCRRHTALVWPQRS